MTAKTVSLTSNVKTISLLRDSASSNPGLDSFRQQFARNLQQGLSAKNIVPVGEGAKAEKLAGLLREPVVDVMDWLMGRDVPDAWQLSKLAKLMNVPADTLINPARQPDRQASMIDEEYHCITLHDETNLSDGYNLYLLPETLRHMNLPRSTTIMTISSEDMAPLYRPNDHVIYDPRVNTISTNGIYVLRLHGHTVIRRTQRVNNGVVRLLCDNAAFDPVEHSTADFTKNPENEDKIFVIGRVLGAIRISNS